MATRNWPQFAFHTQMEKKDLCGNDEIVGFAKRKFECPEGVMRYALERIEEKSDITTAKWGNKTFKDIESCIRYISNMNVYFNPEGYGNNIYSLEAEQIMNIIEGAFDEAVDNEVMLNIIFIGKDSTYKDVNDAPDLIGVELADGSIDVFEGKFYIELSYVKGTSSEKRSVATELQPTIAKWYKATRLIAIIGLLSVLVYIGIRMILSSTGQDKAKYKKMFMDWLTALCLLFVLHYIMAFIIEISSMLTKIFVNNVLGDQNQDILMSSLRNAFELDATFAKTASLAVMYVALVILTCTFTIQYLKRVIYMAFLTMVAPLIALTYPLDKIKDGEAQAFKMWLREYIFNSLLQVVHLFVYCLLVGSSMDFILVNPIYAIVAISFIVPAEKFIRKMFGFDKAETVGTLGAAAGGAAVMSMVNKMKQGGGSKNSAGGDSSGQDGRTKTKKPNWNTPPVNALANPTPPTTPTPPANALANQTPQANTPKSKSGSRPRSKSGSRPGSKQNLKRVLRPGAKQNYKSGPGLGPKSVSQQNKRPGIKGALKAVGKRFWNNGTPIKNLAKAATGGVIGATIGIAAGVASGDLEKAVQYGAAGGVAGYSVAGNIGNTVADYAGTAAEGYLGQDEYNNRKFDKKFMKSDACKKLLQNYGKDKKADIQDMLQYGITDPNDMDTALKNNYTPEDTAKYMKLAKSCPNEMAYDRTKFADYIRNHPDKKIKALGVNPAILNDLYKGMHEFK